MSNTVTWIIKAQDQFSSVAKTINYNIVNITNTLERASRASKNFDNNINRALTKIEAKSAAVKVSAQELGHSLLTLTAPLAAIGLGALHAASKYQQLQVAFTSMSGSAKGAKEELATIQKFARISPFTFFDVARSEKLLRQSHVGKKAILPLMHNLGDIAAGSGMPLQRLSNIMAKITGKGWVTNAEMSQLRAYHIDLLQDISKRTGRSKAQVFADAKKHLISSAMAITELDRYTQKGGIFYKQMEKQLDTLGGSFNKMKEGLEVSGFAFGLWMDKVFGIAQKMKKIGFFLQDSVMPFFITIHKNHPILEQLLKWFVGVTAAILVLTPVMLALSKIYKAWTIIAKLATIAQIAFDVAMAANPFALLIFLIASAAVGLYMFLNYTKQGQAICAAFGKVVIPIFNAVGSAIKEAWQYAKGFYQTIKQINPSNMWKGLKSEVSSLSMHIPFMNHSKTDVNINVRDNNNIIKDVKTNTKNSTAKINHLGKNMVTA